MSRFAIVLVPVVVMSFGKVAAASTPVSWWLDVPEGETINVVEVGPAGLVITDVWQGDNNAMIISLYEDESLKYRLQHRVDPPYYHAMTTGVVFTPGTTLRISHTKGGINAIGLAGYIPSTGNANVPAVGTVGLGIMVIVLLAVGAYVIARRQRPLAA